MPSTTTQNTTQGKERDYTFTRFSLNVGADGTTSRAYTTNTVGHYLAQETVFPNGDALTRTDMGTQNFHGGNLDQSITGNFCGDFRGHHSTSVDGLCEMRVNTDIKVVSSPEVYHNSWQEMADDLQLELVAARSQSEQVPDLSLATAVKDMLKPAPNILDCIKQPKAEDAQKKEDQTKPPTLLENIYTVIADELQKIGVFLGLCNAETLKEMAKVQKNYMKEKAKAAVKAKKKAFENLPEFSQEAFKKGMGKKLFPDGEFNFESLLNIADMITNPLSLLALFISPSTEKLPKQQNFDPEQYQKKAAEAGKRVIEVEKHIG